MAKGRKTGGRKKGTPNKVTVAQSLAIGNAGLTPLEFMLATLRDPKRDYVMRLAAAKDAAPYVHPKLANIELTGPNGGAVQVVVQSSPLDEQL